MNRGMKRILSLFIALVMLMSLSGMAYAAEAPDVLELAETVVTEAEETVEEIPAEEEAPAEEIPEVSEEEIAEEEAPAEEEVPTEEETPALDVILPEDIIAEVEEIVAEAGEEAETLLAEEDANFGIGSNTYADLGSAIAAAKSGDVIVVLQDVTITGNYTIPSGVALLVPFDSSNTRYQATPANDNNAAYVVPTAFRTLTLAEGASITVEGQLEIGAKHHSGASCTGGSSYAGSPTGNVGVIQMNSGSSITVNNGGRMYAWGFVKGSGSVDAKSGATVYENFQILDFGGGSLTVSLGLSNKSNKVFPMSQYYVQNIEVPVTFEYGAVEKVYTTAYMSNDNNSMEITFIGSGGLFVPAEGGRVTKDYNENTDKLVVDVYGNSAINAISLKVKYIFTVTVSSGDFYLPLNGSLEINIHSGTTTVGQNVVVHPGAVINIDEGASVYVPSGCELILFGAEDWSTFINFDRTYTTAPNAYNPRGAECVQDAKIVVNGTLNLSGSLYETNGGADISGTGEIVMNGGAAASKTFKMSAAIGTEPNFKDVSIKSPVLGSVDTAGAAAGTVYAYNPATGTWAKQVAFSADIDKDGDTDTADLVTLMKYIVGAVAAENIDLTVANVNGDDAIDILDVIRWSKAFADGYVFA